MSFVFQNPAISEPEILCQILKIAAGNADAAEKYFIARAALKAEFCIPISIMRVLHVWLSKPIAREISHPDNIPKPLWRMTPKTTFVAVKDIFDWFRETIIAITMTIETIDRSGNRGFTKLSLLP